MMRLLYIGSTSACLERVNAQPFYAPKPFDAAVNGTRCGRFESNVFSVFDLVPNTAYTVCVSDGTEEDTVSFTTAKETCAVDVRAFGAAGDGTSDDTDALQTAINTLPAGGRLIVPPGTYCSRPLWLKSHMTLELQKGAVLLGCADRNAYPVLPAQVTDPVTGEVRICGTFEGIPQPMYQALLSAQNAEDIAIVGEGIVDGNAQNSDFWTAYRQFPTARPRLVSLLHCKDVVFHGITAQHSPSWNFHPFHCERVAFYGVAVKAPKNSPNTDAIDPEACDDVQIIGCVLSVGDDCIAIKSGKLELAKRYAWAADHHTVRNCLMEYGHGAVTLGSESAMGIRNLSVSQCYFRQTDRGLRIKTRRGRGEACAITGISFENIRMENVLTPIVINMWYNCCDPDRESEYVWSREALPVDDRTPHLGSFRFADMDCTGVAVAGCYIDGLPEMPIDSVRLENVTMQYAPNAKPGIPAMQNFAEPRCRLGLYFDNVRRVEADHVHLIGAEGDAIVAQHCDEVTTRDLTEEPLCTN